MKNWKKIRLILALSLLTNAICIAQQSFYFSLESPAQLFTGEMAILNNRDIFFVSCFSGDSINTCGYFGQIDNHGNQKYASSIENHSLSSVLLIADEILLVGTSKNDSGEKEINIYKVVNNNEISIEATFPITSHSNSASSPKAFLNSRNEIVIFYSTFYNIQILVVDTQMNVITQKIYSNFFTFFDLIENPDKNSYTGLSLTDQYRFIVFDTNFEIINEYPGEYYFWLNNFKWINDSTLLNIGKTHDDYIGVETLDKNFNRLKSHEFGAIDTVNHPAFFKALLWPDTGNSFYIFTTKGVSTFHTRPGWLGLAKFNKESLEPEWIRYFGGSDFYYQALSIEQYADDGILLQATRAYIYDEVRKEALVIIKTDTEGNFPLSIDNHPAEMQSQFTVFPNPGQELRIEASVEGALLELYNLNGQLLHTQSLGSGLNSINTDQLPPSTYIYRISLKNDLVGSGKWVKMK
ncbi:MAG: T9SS type A sorting domain-containing protein [Bacteroidales bacterium]|nr:T9SS type A sorting domain-containing protein [Bacteroidales bacterium]